MPSLFITFLKINKIILPTWLTIFWFASHTVAIFNTGQRLINGLPLSYLLYNFTKNKQWFTSKLSVWFSQKHCSFQCGPVVILYYHLLKGRDEQLCHMAVSIPPFHHKISLPKRWQVLLYHWYFKLFVRFRFWKSINPI